MYFGRHNIFLRRATAHLLLWAMLAGFLPPKALAAEKGSHYTPSNCTKHIPNPEEHAKAPISSSKTNCDPNKDRFTEIEKKLFGEDAITKRVDAVVAESHAATQEYVNKAQAAVKDGINQAESQAAVQTLLTKMRESKAKLTKLQDELFTLRDSIRKDIVRVTKSYPVITTALQDLEKEGRRRTKLGEDLKTKIEAAEKRITESQEKIKAAEAAGNGATVDKRNLARLTNHAEWMKRELQQNVVELEKINKAIPQIKAAGQDISNDHKNFDKAGQDWNKVAQKARLAMFRISMNDPAAPPGEKEAAKKGLIELAKSHAISPQHLAAVQSGAASPSSAGDPAGEGKAKLTEEEKRIASLTAGSEAGQHYTHIHELTRKALEEGKIEHKVATNGDLVVATLNEAEEKTATAVRKDAEYFADPEARAKAPENLTRALDDADGTLKKLYGMELQKKTVEGGGYFSSFMAGYEPVEKEKAQELYKEYNAIVDKLSPEERRYWTQVMKMPDKMDDSEIYSSRIAANHNENSTGSWYRNIRDVVAGVGQVDPFGKTTVQDPGWTVMARNNLPQNRDDFQDSYGDVVASRVRQNAYLVTGDTSQMTWGEFRQTWGQHTFEEQRAEYIEAKHSVEVARAQLEANPNYEPPSDPYGVPYDPQLALAEAEENKREVAAKILRENSPVLGDVIAHNPDLAPQATEVLAQKPGGILLCGESRWGCQERKETVGNVILGTIGGPLGQEYVAAHESAKANRLSAFADIYQTPELRQAARKAQDAAEMERGMTFVAGAFTGTGQTVVAGGIYKVAKEQVMLSRAATIAADVGKAADAPVYSVARNIVTHTDELPVPAPAVVERAAPPVLSPVKAIDDAPSVPVSHYRAEVPEVGPPVPKVEAPTYRPSPKIDEVVANRTPLPEVSPATYSPPAASVARTVSNVPSVPAVAAHTGGTIARTVERAETVAGSASHTGRAFDAASTISEVPAKVDVPVTAVAQKVAPTVEVVEKGLAQADVVKAASNLPSNPPLAPQVLPPTQSLRETLVSKFRKVTGWGSKADDTTVPSVPSAPVISAQAAREVASEIEPVAKAVTGSSSRAPELLAVPRASPEPVAVSRAAERVADTGALLSKRAAEADDLRPVAAGRLADDVPAAVKPAALAEDAMKGIGTSEKIAAESASEIAPRAKTFADQARIYSSKTERYLSEMESLADSTRKLKDPAVRAAMGAEEADRLLKRAEKTARYFERRLEEKYFVPKSIIEDFKKGVASGTIKSADIPKLAEEISVRGILESPLAKGKVLAAENKYQKILEAAAKADGASLSTLKSDEKLKAALEAGWRRGSIGNRLPGALDGMPPQLSRAVAKSFDEAVKSGENVKDLVPFLARSIAEAEVLSRNAPVIGRNIIETMQNIVTRPIGSLQGVMSTTGRIAGQATGLRYLYRLASGQKGMVGAKSLSLLALESRLAHGAITADRQLASAMERAHSATQAEALSRAELFPEKTTKDPRFAKSLLLQADRLSSNIEGRVGDLVRAQSESDPLLKALKTEIAARALEHEHKIPRLEIEAFRNRLRQGVYSGDASPELIKEQAGLLAQEKFLSEKNVKPRVNSLERQLGAALSSASKGPEGVARAEKKLAELGVPDEVVARWARAEIDQPGLIRHQGEIRNVAGSIILQSNAREMLGKNFVLNSTERLRRMAEVGMLVGMLPFHGLAAGARWVGGYRRPEQVKGLPAFADLRAFEEIRLDRVDDIALSGLAHISLSEGNYAAGLKKAESALAQAGYKPENIRAAAELMKKDVDFLRAHFKGTPFEHQPMAANMVQAKAMRDDYLDILKSGRGSSGAAGEDGTRLLDEFAKIPSSRPDANDLAIRAQKNFGARIDLGNLPPNIEGRAIREADGTLKMALYEKVAEKGQIGAEAVVNHEARHLRNLSRQEQIDKLYARSLSASASEADRAIARKQLISASVGSGEFRAATEVTFRQMGDAYAQGHSLDEVEAYLVSATTYVNRAKDSIASASSHRERLLASANLMLAENTLKESARMAESSRANLAQVKEALGSGGVLSYDPATGATTVNVRARDWLRPAWGFDYQAQLPKNLKQDEVEPLLRELIESSGKRNEHLASKVQERVARSYHEALARLDTPDPDPAFKGRGVPVYTSRAREEAPPAVRAALDYRELAEEKLAAVRRRVLSGKAGFEEYEKEAAALPRLGKSLPSGDEGARRLALLQEEENHLARKVAKVEAELDEAREAKDASSIRDAALALRNAELEHAGFAALALGQAEARMKALQSGKASAGLKAALSKLGEQDFLRHQASFPGKTLAQVLADPAESKYLAALSRADAINQEKAIADARARLERTLATYVAKGNGVQARRMAEALIAENGARPGALKLVDRGWPKEMVESCPPAICKPALDVKEAKVSDGSLLAREAMLDRELPQAGVRSRSEAGALVAELPPQSSKLSLKKAESMKTRLAAEADAAAKAGASQKATAELKAAQAAVDEKVRVLQREAAVLAKPAPLDPAELAARNSMVSEVTRILRTMSEEELAAIHPKLAGHSQKGVSGGSERFRLYKRSFQAEMAELPPLERAEVFSSMRKAIADRPGMGGLKRSTATDEALASAFRRGDELVSRGGETDPAAMRALYKDAKLDKDEAALADALGLGKVTTPSALERRAEIVAAERTIDDKLKTAVAEAKPSANRAPASVPKNPEKLDAAGVEDLMRRELGKGSFDKTEIDAFASQAKLLEEGRSEAEIFGLASAMKGLRGSPDLYESMKISYAEAWKAKQANPKLKREQAMRIGVKKMLVDAGFKDEIDGPAGMLERTMASLACMRL